MVPKAYLKGILKVVQKELYCGMDVQKLCITFLYKLPRYFQKDQWECLILLTCVNYGQKVHNRLTKSCEPDCQGQEKWHGYGPPKQLRVSLLYGQVY